MRTKTDAVLDCPRRNLHALSRNEVLEGGARISVGMDPCRACRRGEQRSGGRVSDRMAGWPQPVHRGAFVGIPLVAVFDRPKTVALQWDRDGVVTECNPTFAGHSSDTRPSGSYRPVNPIRRITASYFGFEAMVLKAPGRYNGI